jgi:hypothetical protein
MTEVVKETAMRELEGQTGDTESETESEAFEYIFFDPLYSILSCMRI